MSGLFFVDESGHDHRTMPYEVRGGVAIHAGRVWDFVQDIQRREMEVFGRRISVPPREIKGRKLLGKDRFRWADQGSSFAPDERRELCGKFLDRTAESKPRRTEFTAYGQACLSFAHEVFDALRQHGAKLFASAIPRRVQKPSTFEADEYLRKDQVFLFERFFYFLAEREEHGLIVMDQTERTMDQRFLHKMHEYFTRTQTGKYRTSWIVPTPLFVSSEMTLPIQAADLCIYCVNWGFRLPNRGMNAVARPEIAHGFGPWMASLQYQGEVSQGDRTFTPYGIVFVPDPYEARPSP